MKIQHSVELILIPALLFFIPAAYGLGFTVGISDGGNSVSDSFNLNAGLETSLNARIEASPEYYSSQVDSEGSGAFSFDETFQSSENGGEYVRLTSSMSDSSYHSHKFAIEKQTGDEIRASQTLTVRDGKDIDCSAQAWNSQGQSAKVGLKIPSGSLIDYSSYGDATEKSVEAGQSATIPRWTVFKVSSELRSKYSLQRSSAALISSRNLNADTRGYLDETAAKSRTTFKLA